MNSPPPRSVIVVDSPSPQPSRERTPPTPSVRTPPTPITPRSEHSETATLKYYSDPVYSDPETLKYRSATPATPSLSVDCPSLTQSDVECYNFTNLQGSEEHSFPSLQSDPYVHSGNASPLPIPSDVGKGDYSADDSEDDGDDERSGDEANGGKDCACGSCDGTDNNKNNNNPVLERSFASRTLASTFISLAEGLAEDTLSSRLIATPQAKGEMVTD